MIAIFAAAFVIGVRTSDRVFHGVFAVAWSVACISGGVAGLDNPIMGG